jgi:hypothetical protein
VSVREQLQLFKCKKLDINETMGDEGMAHRTKSKTQSELGRPLVDFSTNPVL